MNTVTAGVVRWVREHPRSVAAAALALLVALGLALQPGEASRRAEPESEEHPLFV